MGSFRDARQGNKMDKHAFKMAVGKSYIVRVAVDQLEQWEEVWPTFPGEDSKTMRRFVLTDDKSNYAPISRFASEHDISKMLGGDKRLTDNWRSKYQNATIVIVGVEQIVKGSDGKKKRKIIWDTTAKVMQFGSTIMGKMNAINHNPLLIERAEANPALAGKMGDPDSADGYLCTDVYALRITKEKNKNRIEYDVQADKLVGKMKESKLVSLEEVKDALADHIKPTPTAEIEKFIIEQSGGNVSSASSADAEFETEQDDSSDDVQEDSVDEEVTPEIVEDDDEEEKPKKSDSKKAAKEDDEDDLEIDDLDLPDPIED